MNRLNRSDTEKAVLAKDGLEYLRRQVRDRLRVRYECFDTNRREASPLEQQDRTAIAVYEEVLQLCESAIGWGGNPFGLGG